MRWLLLAPLVISVNVILVLAWLTHDARRWRGLRGGGDPVPAARCQTVLVARTVTQPTLVLAGDGQLRVEDHRVRRNQLVQALSVRPGVSPPEQARAPFRAVVTHYRIVYRVRSAAPHRPQTRS